MLWQNLIRDGLSAPLVVVVVVVVVVVTVVVAFAVAVVMLPLLRLSLVGHFPI